MQTPSAAAAAASAAAVAVASRPDWLAAGAPALSHGQRRVRLTGGAAGAALARGQANRGARDGAGPRLPAGLCPDPASRASSPPAHRRLHLLLPHKWRPGRAPAEPTHRRRAGAGAGAEALSALALSLAPAPPLSICHSAEKEAGLAGGRRLPGSLGPAPPPPHSLPYAPALPRALGRGSAWERDG